MPGTIDPSDRVSAILAGATPVTDQVTAVLTPILAAADDMRAALDREGLIFEVPTTPVSRTIAATDGAWVSSPLVVGDLVNALAVTAVNTPTEAGLGGLGIADGLDYSGFTPHSAGKDSLPKAMMMTFETVLSARTPADHSVLSIIDGTHTSAYATITEALAVADAASPLLAQAAALDLPAAFHALATHPDLVAMPKSSSATDLWDTLGRLGVTMPTQPLPDKALATILLTPGTGVYLHGKPRNLLPVAARGAGAQMAVACRDAMADTPALDDYQVLLAKPHGVDTVFRIEAPGDSGIFQAIDNATSIVRSECVPHITEPLVQHLADTFCKEQVTAATAWTSTIATRNLTDLDPCLAGALAAPYRTTN